MRSADSKSLQERLLRAGVAPRHAERLTLEWQLHLNSLTEEALEQGMTPAEAGASAERRIGTPDDLVVKTLEQRTLLSLGARWPLLFCSVLPIIGLVASFVASALLIGGVSAIVEHARSAHAQLSPTVVTGVQAIFWIVLYGLPVAWVMWLAHYTATRRLLVHWALVGVILTALVGASVNLSFNTAQDFAHASMTLGAGISTRISHLATLTLRSMATLVFAALTYYTLIRRRTQPAF